MSKRNELEIAQDRALVCKMLAKGYRSKTEIAAIINQNREEDKHISTAQIHNDIEYMRNKYLKEGVEDYQLYRNQLLHELTVLQTTFWEGYELSRRNKISIQSEFITDEDEYQDLKISGMGLTEDEKVFQRQAKVFEEQRLEGSPAMLQGVLSCIDRKAKILGVDAPNKVAMTDVSGTKNSSDLLEYMKSQINELSTKMEEKSGIDYEEETKLLHD